MGNLINNVQGALVMINEDFSKTTVYPFIQDVLICGKLKYDTR